MRLGGGLAATGLVAVALAAWFVSAPRRIDEATATIVSGPGDAAAGRSVFFAAGCASCHKTPGQSDPTWLGGGLTLKSPFGAFHPPNISPDPVDGLGRWTAADLANALLMGVSPAGEHYYPALPYTSYRRLRPEDVRDLYAYLKTLPPAHGRAPPHELGFPFNIRRLVGFWKALFLGEDRLPPRPDKSAEWTRGRYLVEGPGHCAECHSRRNALGAVIASSRLTGGPNLEGHGVVPDITAKGLAEWSEADIAEALSSGFTPQGDSLGSSMAEVVRNTAELSPRDRQSVAVYLKSYAAP